jgi:hypothetical protein
MDWTHMLKEAGLLFDGHGIDESLIPVSQIAREPARRFGDAFRGPLPVGQLKLREWPAFRYAVRKRILGIARQETDLYFVEGSLSMLVKRERVDKWRMTRTSEPTQNPDGTDSESNVATQSQSHFQGYYFRQ